MKQCLRAQLKAFWWWTLQRAAYQYGTPVNFSPLFLIVESKPATVHPLLSARTTSFDKGVRKRIAGRRRVCVCVDLADHGLHMLISLYRNVHSRPTSSRENTTLYRSYANHGHVWFSRRTSHFPAHHMNSFCRHQRIWRSASPPPSSFPPRIMRPPHGNVSS